MKWIRLLREVLGLVGAVRHRVRPGPTSSTPPAAAPTTAPSVPQRGRPMRWLVIGLVALVVPGGLALAAILWWRRRHASKGTA